MKLLLLIVSLTVSYVFSGVTTASASNSPYVLDVVRNERNTKTLRLKNKKSGSVVWTRKIFGPRITWADNGRALAVEGGIRSILVWREGYRLRNFAVPGGGDGSMGCVWSPDNRRLLIRSIKSAQGEAGVGALFCLRLGKWPHYSYSLVAPEVAEMGWRNSQIVLYRRLNWKTMMVDKKLHWRRVP